MLKMEQTPPRILRGEHFDETWIRLSRLEYFTGKINTRGFNPHFPDSNKISITLGVMQMAFLNSKFFVFFFNFFWRVRHRKEHRCRVQSDLFWPPLWCLQLRGLSILRTQFTLCCLSHFLAAVDLNVLFLYKKCDLSHHPLHPGCLLKAEKQDNCFQLWTGLHPINHLLIFSVWIFIHKPWLAETCKD